MNFAEELNSEGMVLLLKIVGAIAAFLSFKWLVKIYGGKDGLDLSEFIKLAGLILLSAAVAWMLYVEGTRTHEWAHFTIWHFVTFVVPLIFILHLEKSLKTILEIYRTIKGTTTFKSEHTEVTKEEIKKTDG